MYCIKIQHYGEQAQVMDGKPAKRKTDAEHRLQQEAFILQGYTTRHGWIDGAFIVFGEDGTFNTRMWIAKV